jgi:hypothetical protein
VEPLVEARRSLVIDPKLSTEIAKSVKVWKFNANLADIDALS